VDISPAKEKRSASGGPKLYFLVMISGQCQEHPCSEDASNPACQFFKCIRNASVTIWNKILQELKNDCVTEDEEANKQGMAGVRQIEQKSENSVCTEPLKNGEEGFIETNAREFGPRIN